jgi:hypothetical protein
MSCSASKVLILQSKQLQYLQLFCMPCYLMHLHKHFQTDTPTAGANAAAEHQSWLLSTHEHVVVHTLRQHIRH